MIHIVEYRLENLLRNTDFDDRMLVELMTSSLVQIM